MNPVIFLLGGHDLEMSTIKQLLDGEENCVVYDRNLRWDNAYLSAYKAELCLSSPLDIYGIELKEDIPVPRCYHRIDHHNDWADKPSSLEQVAVVLNIQLTRRQQLVSANDKGYIPAMKALGATNEEIADIRRQDRAAQGVTDADEALAELSIAKNLSRINETFIVKSLTPHFSAICDRLYPYRRLLVYTDEEWVFYGDGKEALVAEMADGVRAGCVYCGGGKYGYIGAIKGAFPREDIKDFVEMIKLRYEQI